MNWYLEITCVSVILEISFAEHVMFFLRQKWQSTVTGSVGSCGGMMPPRIAIVIGSVLATTEISKTIINYKLVRFLNFEN